jgi:hypothetical protein
MVKCLNRITDAMTVQGWERWLGVYAYEDWAAAAMLRCLDHLAHVSSSQAWNQWAAFTRYGRDHELQQKHQTSENKQAGRRIVYCLNRITDACIAQGWERWLSVFEHEDWAAGRMIRSLDHITHALLSQGWNKWVVVTRLEQVRDQLRQVDAEQLLGARLASAGRVYWCMNHWLKGMVTKAKTQAFAVWLAMISKQRRLEETTRHAAISLRRWAANTVQNRCRASWYVWQLAVQDLFHEDMHREELAVRTQKAIRRCLGKWEGRLALSGWDRWVATMPNKEHQRTLRVMKRCVDRFAHTLVSTGWNQWKTVIMAFRQIDSIMVAMRSESAYIAQEVELRLRTEHQAELTQLKRELREAKAEIHTLKGKKIRPPPAPAPRNEYHAMKILNKWKEKVSQQQAQHQEEVMELRTRLNTSDSFVRAHNSSEGYIRERAARSPTRKVNRTTDY